MKSLIFSVSAQDADAAAIDTAEHSVAVKFQLVQPLIIGRGFSYKKKCDWKHELARNDT
jgi:hypothetical protein